MLGTKRKGELPQKPCRRCGRPMVWRKRWRANWDEVLYCSDRCQAEAKRERSAEKSRGPA